MVSSWFLAGGGPEGVGLAHNNYILIILQTPLESFDYPAARWRCASRLDNYGEVTAGHLLLKEEAV